MKIGEENWLFGSITSNDISIALKKLGFDIDKKKFFYQKLLKFWVFIILKYNFHMK